MKQDTIVMSVGGSIVNPKTGFDREFLRAFRTMIRGEIKKGKRFILIIGGGATCRLYQDALRDACKKVTFEDLDWLGIEATKMNAAFMKLFFGETAYKDVVADPTQKVKTTKKLIIASGWKPGNSSDLAAVKFAETYGAMSVMNLSNIKYAYTKDPNKYKDAEKIERMDWETFRREVVGYTWEPGMSVPFDPIASGLAQKIGITVSILDGTNLKEVRKAIAGRGFEGTVVHP